MRKFYSLSGHSRDGSDSGQTLESVMIEERANPNSTVDAARLVGAAMHLLSTSPFPVSKLLDVGCGYGFYAKEAIEHNFLVTAIELAATERAISRQLTGIDPLNTTFEDFEAEAASFSVIIMSQILEHARDINLWLAKANRLLHEGGVIAIALPNFGSVFRRVMQERDPFVTPPAHLNYFDARNLERLLLNHGFVVRQVAWQSRISPASLRRRLPVAGRVLGGLSNLALGAIDRVGLGMMVNVHATKVGATSIGAMQ